METLHLEGTDVSPKVLFSADSRTLEIGGYSRPENAKSFYTPIIQWIEEFKEWVLKSTKEGVVVDPVVIKFKFIYFNSSSVKFIYDIVEALITIQNSNIPLITYWYHDEDDDELREMGEELSEMSNIPFQFVGIGR